jgi:hypothetical protein
MSHAVAILGALLDRPGVSLRGVYEIAVTAVQGGATARRWLAIGVE